MRNVRFEYIIEELAKVVEDMKYSNAHDQDEFREDLRVFRKIIKSLGEQVRQEHEDSAFFEGELEEKREYKQEPFAHVKREDAKEEGWVTTENGHHVHIGGDGNPDIGNKHVLEVMNGSGKKSRKDFYPKDSYQNTEEFEKHRSAWIEAHNKSRELSKQIREMEEEVRKEFTPKPRSEWTEGDRIDDILGNPPGKYTEKGKKLKEEFDKKKVELRKEISEMEKVESEESEYLDLEKYRARARQLESYEQPEMEKAVDDNYEGFTTETTGTVFGDELLNGKNSFIAEMSPKEYLERCAFEIFDGTLESTINGVIDEDAQKYAEKMKNGEKFDLPYLNYRDNSQEGRHRAVAAYLAGIEKMPVLIAGKPPTKEDMGFKLQEAKYKARKAERAYEDRKKGSNDIDFSDVDLSFLNLDNRNDAADDEEGRWVTTENDHKVHLNEEGVPDKGNPHVIQAMTNGTKTREEINHRRVEKIRNRIKSGIDAYKKADERVRESAEKYDEIFTKFHRAEGHVDHIEKIYKKMLSEHGIKDGDRDRLEKEVKELEEKHKENPRDRELEGQYNNRKFFLAMYDDTYSDEAKKIVKEFPELKKECEDAKKRLDNDVEERRKCLKEIRKHTERNVQSIKFHSDEERKKIKDDFLSSSVVSRLTDEDKEKIEKSIESASDAQLSVLKNTMKNAKIMAVEDTVDPYASSHYNPSNGIIYLQEEDMSNPRTFWHEWGHYMDDFGHSGLGYDVVTRGEGSKWEGRAHSFTDVLDEEVKVFGQDGADDLQELFEKIAPGKFSVKTNSEGNYISVNDAETGSYIDLHNEASWSLQESFDKVVEEFVHGGPNGGEIGEYRRSIGWPDDSERPKRDDYIEIYVTPKRKLEREREKYKGAEEEFYKKLDEYYERQEKAKKSDPEFNRKMDEMWERRKRREKNVPPVSDCLCAMMMGQVFSIYGCHERDYYRMGDHALNEWAANIHQMMFSGDKEAIDYMSSLLPRTMKKVKKAYNEYLWRNMSI